MRFEFSTARQIIFGNGSINQLIPLISNICEHVLIATGSSIDRAKPVSDQLNEKDIPNTIFQVPGEPTTQLVLEGIKLARSKKCDLVIGIGGGSVIDAGKVIAALLTNTGELFDYLEVIGKGRNISIQPAPYIAIPTTAGTGAEVTRNAVLGSTEHKVKVSMRSHLMLPYITIVDPELTLSMPPAVTASTGLDALTQLVEVYVSNKANPMTDGICFEGIKRAGRSLLTAYRQGDNRLAREDMSLASLFSGMALANAKLGAVHGFAAPLGGMYSASHGVICAILLPQVIEENVNALTNKDPEAPALKRYDHIAQILTGENKATAKDAVIWIKNICGELKIPKLNKFGCKEKDIPAIITKAKNASSMQGNPVKLTDSELTRILIKAM